MRVGGGARSVFLFKGIMSAPLAERFREMSSLWHLWSASVQEELGELPPGLEEAVETTLANCLLEARLRLKEAQQACEVSLGSLSSRLVPPRLEGAAHSSTTD